MPRRRLHRLVVACRLLSRVNTRRLRCCAPRIHKRLVSALAGTGAYLLLVILELLIWRAALAARGIIRNFGPLARRVRGSVRLQRPYRHFVNPVDGVARGANHVINAAIFADARHLALKARLEVHRYLFLFTRE